MCIIVSTVASASIAATAFGDQLVGLRADDVDAENLAVLLVGDHLDEAVVTAEDRRLAVADERKLADLHLEALRLGLRFGQADAADSGLGVGRAGNAILVDRDGRLAGHVIDRDHAFHGRDVRQLRRARDDVADRVDARFAGLLILIHLDEAAIEFDLGVLEADLLGVRLAADRDQQLSNSISSCLAARRASTVSCTPLPVFRMFSALAPVSHANALLLEDLFELLRDFLVLDRNEARQHLEHRDLRAEAMEDGRELDADRAGADDRQRLRNRGEIQNLDVGEDELRIGLRGREACALPSRWR